MGEEMAQKRVPRWRWVLVSVGIVIFAWLTGMAALMGVVLANGPAMEWFGVLVSGAWTAAVVGLVLGSCPRGWFRAGILSWILMMMVGFVIAFEDPSMALLVYAGIYCGGVLVLGSYVKCTGRRSWKWAAVGAALLCLYFLGRIWDVPAIPDDSERYLGKIDGGGIEGFYSYGLGGFVETESLWRIDGATETILGRLKEDFQVEPVAQLPARFFQMRPYYWPDQVPAGGALYASPGFSNPDRGLERSPRGGYCVALVDSDAKRVYLWVKRSL